MMMAKAQSKAPLLSVLLKGIADVAPEQDCTVSGLSLNSRELLPGDLFAAMAGVHHHGISFIDQAVDAGAVAILCEYTEGLPERWNCPIPVVVIEELSQQLGRVASRFYGYPSRAMKIVGVTGTNGKTTCAQLLAQVLSDRQPCGVIGTLGYGLYGSQKNGGHTTPNAIEVHRLLAEMRDAGAKHVVMEVSSHALEQGRAVGVAIDIAVFTNLSRDHLDYHGDMKNYGNAKRRLFTMKGVKHAVINMDDAFGRALLHELSGHMRLTAYSLELTSGLPAYPLVSGSNLRLQRDGIQLLIRDPNGSVTVNSSLLGRFNAANLLAVYSVLMWMELPRNLIAARLGRCTPVAGRMECFSEPGTALVVVDYAHTPDALEQVLESLREHCQGRIWCLFGCGGERDKGKRPLMGALAERNADRVILTDDNPRGEDPAQIICEIVNGVEDRKQIKVIADRAKAIRYAVANAAVEDVVLVAGKGHEDYQLVAGETLPFSDTLQVKKALAECVEQQAL